MKITNPKNLVMSGNNPSKVLLSVIIILVATFHACKKEDSSSETAALQEEFASATAESDAEAETVFNDVFDNVMGVNDEVAIGGTGLFTAKQSNITIGGVTVNNTGSVDTTACFTVTITQLGSTRFPLKAVIDFGLGCTGRDGRTRKGKIIIVYSGRLVLPGNSATTTFDGYYVNDTKIEGTHMITNTSTQDVRSFTIQVKNAKLSKSNGNYTQWNSEKTITQTEGLATPLVALDDVFKLSGHAGGTVKRGDRLFQWETVITEALTKKFSCRWIVKGTISIRKGSSSVAILDYGTGDCDAKATFTVNGVVHEITLH